LQTLARAKQPVAVGSITVRAMSGVAMSRFDKGKNIDLDAIKKNVDIVKKRCEDLLHSIIARVQE
jgi:hypothetical protein